MLETHIPADDEELVAAVTLQLAEAHAARQEALDGIAALDANLAALGYHPNYPAYVHGGMFAEQGLGTGHVLALLGFHTLDWHEAIERLSRGGELSDEGDTPFARLQITCESDPMLELAGEQFAGERGLLKGGRINPLWFKRPKLGLGQPAKAFALGAEHANGHRGLYDLPLAQLHGMFANVSPDHSDQRFGALLLSAIVSGGEQLAETGAAAFHRGAEDRYREDYRRFAEHQRSNPSRRWRWKPPLSKQGHLAVTTARAKDIDLPAARTRGHAANWLSDQDANLRFNGEDQS